MSRANPRFHRNNPALPAINTAAYRVQVFYSVDEQICLWGIDIIMDSSSVSGAAEQNLAVSFKTANRTFILACLASDCFLTAFKVTSLTTPSRIPWIQTEAGGSSAGTVTGSHLPSEMAMVTSKQTSTKGQHGRGRLYLPGVPSSFLTPATDANRLNSTGASAQFTLENSLFTSTYVDAANNGHLAVTTTPPTGQPTSKGQLIAHLIGDSLLGVIRRRRIGRGK